MDNSQNENSGISKEGKKESKFNFGINSEKMTGSIQELVNELNAEREDINGKEYTSASLATTIGFINKVTGLKIKKSSRNISITILKTIKLLFIQKRNSKIRLISRIQPLESEENGTIEFFTVSTTHPDKDSAKIIDSILSEIAIEIPESHLILNRSRLGYNKYHSTAEMFIIHIENTNKKVSQILGKRFSYDELILSNAYLNLSKKIDEFSMSFTEGFSENNVHENIYVYLSTLGLRHFIIGQRMGFYKNKVNIEIGSIDNDLLELVDYYNINLGSSLKMHDPIFSVNNFRSMIKTNSEKMSELIKIATGYDTDQRKLYRIAERALPLLMIYAYRTLGEENPNAQVFTFVDIIAALCAFRYVKESKIEYTPIWKGQQSQGSDPQSLYDKGWGISAGKFRDKILLKNIFQHQGVFQIYYDVFSEFQAVFNGRSTFYFSWMQFQLSRLRVYEKIVSQKSINELWKAADMFDEFCIKQAKDLNFI